MPTPPTKKSVAKSSVIERPLVTEKSTNGTAANRPAYSFVVATGANKIMVRQAIIEQYKVTPVKINMTVVKPKKVMSRGRIGSRGGMKKAIVFLKPGDKIEIA